MPLYVYYKAPVGSTPSPVSTNQPPVPKRVKMKRLVGPLLITLGSLLVANVTWPILSYQLFIAPSLQNQAFISPLPENLLGTDIAMASAVPNALVPQVLGAESDFTNPTTWFPNASNSFNTNQPVDRYTVSIPKLKIKDATVLVDGTDLSQSLIQYPGTAIPGDPGSTVIFGHSVLRQFYNPAITNSKRYVSIFSTLMTLKKGDQIFIDWGSQRLTYEVDVKLEVNPEDLYILEQQSNARDLKLITCVPEGTYLRRGVVIAKFVDRTNVNTNTVLQ